jgi:hypothetical protein
MDDEWSEAVIAEEWRRAGLVYPPQGPDFVEIVHEPALTVDTLIAHLEWVRETYGGGVVVCVPIHGDDESFMAADRSIVADHVALFLRSTAGEMVT